VPVENSAFHVQKLRETEKTTRMKCLRADYFLFAQRKLKTAKKTPVPKTNVNGKNPGPLMTKNQITPIFLVGRVDAASIHKVFDADA